MLEVGDRLAQGDLDLVIRLAQHPHLERAVQGQHALAARIHQLEPEVLGLEGADLARDLSLGRQCAGRAVEGVLGLVRDGRVGEGVADQYAEELHTVVELDHSAVEAVAHVLENPHLVGRELAFAVVAEALVALESAGLRDGRRELGRRRLRVGALPQGDAVVGGFLHAVDRADLAGDRLPVHAAVIAGGDHELLIGELVEEAVSPGLDGDVGDGDVGDGVAQGVGAGLQGGGIDELLGGGRGFGLIREGRSRDEEECESQKRHVISIEENARRYVGPRAHVRLGLLA